ncbi:MAG: 4-(cytidine 5'-diphospho)-2-C-methyl-D-erythritol kinase [Crocinitomicaceae bacterium]|nr:4-(cytidine 5'-diphospho)-2-C-methyl-D-erythritol kinase [Crocinitomicaceae bacterium]MBK8925579.1 4-(cytidine 5'-diphospho)-2-C-methyl-D-erythritol kinase [Crocinitomicaceae bacterium]
MICFPNAKINIGLSVKDKRADGYHNIESIFYPVNWCDILEIVPSNSFEFFPSGLCIEGATKNNLVVKAYEILKEKHGLPPVHIFLHKVIPMGAGLGGGSADGAFALRLLNDLFELNLDTTQLQQLAATLGSDCPFFIQNVACKVTGRGEIISPIQFSLAGKWIKLVYPGIHINTKTAFEQLNKNALKRKPFDRDASQDPFWFFQNDFEAGAIELFPTLGNVRENLLQQGAYYVSMTGSGSCFYGLFHQKPTDENQDHYTSFVTQLV